MTHFLIILTIHFTMNKRILTIIALSLALLVCVYSQPTITQQPQDAMVCSGGSVTLNVSATCSSSISYQWYYSTDGTYYNEMAGKTNSYLVVY